MFQKVCLIILSSSTVIFLCFDRVRINYNSQILTCKQKQRCGWLGPFNAAVRSNLEIVWEAIRVSKDSRVDPPSSLSSVILTKGWFLGTISSEMSASPFFSDSESCNNLQNCLVSTYTFRRTFSVPSFQHVLAVVSTQMVKNGLVTEKECLPEFWVTEQEQASP